MPALPMVSRSKTLEEALAQIMQSAAAGSPSRQAPAGGTLNDKIDKTFGNSVVRQPPATSQEPYWRQVLQQAFPRTIGNYQDGQQEAAKAWQRGDIAGSIGHEYRGAMGAGAGLVGDTVFPVTDTIANGLYNFFGGLAGTEASRAADNTVTTAQPTAEPATTSAGMDFTVEGLRDAFKAQESSNNYAAVQKDTGALGAYQIMPSTGKTLAKMLGMDWRPDLMQSTTAEGIKYQDAIGGAAISEAIANSGGDPANIFRYYHGGSNRNIWGPKTEKYAQEMLARVGGGSGGVNILGMPTPGFQNPFDPALFNKALGQLDKGEQAALQPFSTTVNMPDAPEFPDLPSSPKRDWTEQDAALEALRPQVMTEKTRARVMRSNWMQGIAQGLMNIPEGAGLGKTLAMLGGGALAGRAAGDAEIQARMDSFDDKMAQFNALQFQYAGNKGEVQYQEAVAEVGAMYTHNMNQFQHKMQQFAQNNQIGVQGNNIIVRSKDGNKSKTEIIPIKPAVQASFAVQRAGLFSDMGRQQQQGNGLTASATNQFIASAAMANAARGSANSSTSGTAALFQSGYMISSEVLSSGAGPSLLGKEVFSGLMEEASNAVLDEGLDPGSTQYAQRVQQHASMLLYGKALADPEMMKLLQNAAPVMQEAYAVNRAREATTTERTRNGNTITTRKE